MGILMPKKLYVMEPLDPASPYEAYVDYNGFKEYDIVGLYQLVETYIVKHEKKIVPESELLGGEKKDE